MFKNYNYNYINGLTSCIGCFTFYQIVLSLSDIEFLDGYLTLFTHIYRWERSGKCSMLNSHIVTRAIEANLTSLTSVFTTEVHHMHVIADLLDTLEIPSSNDSYSPPIQVILNLTKSIIHYFFACCKDDGKFFFLIRRYIDFSYCFSF